MSSPFKAWLDHLPPAREKLFVVMHGSQWKVRHNERLSEPYLTSACALRAAIDEAQTIGRQGSGAQVFVPVMTGGEFRLEWTYGLDPYPAKT